MITDDIHSFLRRIAYLNRESDLGQESQVIILVLRDRPTRSLHFDPEPRRAPRDGQGQEQVGYATFNATGLELGGHSYMPVAAVACLACLLAEKAASRNCKAFPFEIIPDVTRMTVHPLMAAIEYFSQSAS